MATKRMTFDAYDDLCEELSQMPATDPNYWPNMQAFYEHIEPDKLQYIEFLIYLVETNDPPKTDAEKKSLISINNVLYRTLELVD